MANSVTIKQDASVGGKLTASIFNAEGTPVLTPQQEFNVNDNMVWDPAKYNAAVTEFYIAKGTGPVSDNPSVVYAVKVEFDKSVTDATITIGVAQVPGKDGASGCYYFTAVGEGVKCSIIKDGVLIPTTELPSRCSQTEF